MSNWMQGLRARRIATGQRPVDLARIINVTPTSYMRYERGERPLMLDKAYALADALGTTVDALRYFTPELEEPILLADPNNDQSQVTPNLVPPDGWELD